ncbi:MULTISPECIES: flagellar hook-length control protein FliK [unclassified Sphingobium]|uniref:flagellar hook-length control protein FliK n=1 Tax=unclassified Sphingobium TaxID=2611147 RepID=UPI002224026D|nr:MULTISPECIES: flagellar hook-length control protein FliK [unclassified Sphingobium]MCW2383504.1 flagellar hook-length control protein FliK [Sphingobium sp. B2D3B]MCW2399521.1 flagellar hook-length control protein FliK [Sphingobium sp. B2D3C]
MINITSLFSMMTGRAPAADAKAGEPGLATGGQFAALVELAALNGNAPAAGGAGLSLVVDNDGTATTGPAGAPDEGFSADILALVGGEKLALTAPDRFASQPQQAVTVAAQLQAQQAQQGAATAQPPQDAALALTEGEPNADAEAGDAAATDEGATNAAAPGQPLQAQVIPFPLAPGMPAMAAHVAAGTGSKGGRAAASSQDGATAAAGVAALAAPKADGADSPNTEGASLADALAAQSATTGKATAPAPDTAQRFVIDLPVGISTESGAVSSSGGAGPAAPSAASALGAQVIDMGVSGQWIDRLAREIAGLAEGGGHSRFSLNPPHLGRLEVDVFQGAGAMDIRLTAETDEAARRLNEGRGTLQADARLATLHLGQITVEKAGASSDTARDQGQAQSQAQNQAQNQAQGQAQRDLASQMQQQGRGQDGDRGTSFPRVAGEQSRQPDESRVAARDSADGHVRFA